MAEEVPTTVNKTGHLASACLSHASGGRVTETANNDDDPKTHTVMVAKETSYDVLTPADKHAAGKEPETDVTRDGEYAPTLGATEYTECVGTYLGDLTSAHFV